jgi:hypothetical protein
VAGIALHGTKGDTAAPTGVRQTDLGSTATIDILSTGKLSVTGSLTDGALRPDGVALADSPTAAGIISLTASNSASDTLDPHTAIYIPGTVAAYPGSDGKGASPGSGGEGTAIGSSLTLTAVGDIR